MGTLKIQLVFVFFLQVIFSFAQEDDINEKENVNDYTHAANSLIWHVNLNENRLIVFQQELNNWNTNANGKGQPPQYLFTSTIDKSTFKGLTHNTLSLGTKSAFNYKQALLILYNKVNQFNQLCKQLSELKQHGDYYERCMDILEQIGDISKEFVDLSYDFSLSAAINFGESDLPKDLDFLKNIVGQSKNVIMAMRNDNSIQLKSYLSHLNSVIRSSVQVVNMNTLRREGGFRISTADIEIKKSQILETANQIAYWAEQYLQSNQTQEDKELFLYNAVEAFNSSSKKLGNAGTYNSLVDKATVPFLQFTEEPIPFNTQRTISKVIVSKESLKEENILAKEVILKTNKIENTLPKEIFDSKNENSLAGAKANNIVFLMDVSPSMLSSGKFPLLKESLLHLMNILRPQDEISLVAYSGEAKVLFENAGMNDKAAIKLLLDTLESNGGTDLVNGLTLAYQIAQKSFKEGENNKVIIASDGKFGVNALALAMVEQHAVKDIHLSVLQIMDDIRSVPKPYLNTLTNKGKGNYRLLSNSEEAKSQLMKEVKIE